MPVVAFDVGGTSDIIVHKQTGWLASPYKAAELADGVAWCVKNQALLSKNCIEKARADFDTEETVEKMIDLYSSMVKH